METYAVFLMQSNNSEGGQLKSDGKSQKLRQRGFEGVIYRQSHRGGNATLTYEERG